MGDIPEMTRVKKIVHENPFVKTFFLDKKIDAKPGQFVMMWLPGTDEKPFSLSYAGKETGVTVEKKGKFTEKMFQMKEGDQIGIRGPYGNGFIPKPNACIVAGGCGIAPLSTLVERLDDAFLIMGAKTKERLIFENRFRNPTLMTDDGSFGEKGFTTDALEKLLKSERIDVVYTCGPEIMMKKVFDLCEKHEIECQASLERFMKCSFGVCGQCDINGFRVCKDGPIFSSDHLREMNDFGKRARLKTGKKVPVDEYSKWRCA
jgi:dihydroorotate dehydrogenase electron transfer subunit